MCMKRRQKLAFAIRDDFEVNEGRTSIRKTTMHISRQKKIVLCSEIIAQVERIVSFYAKLINSNQVTVQLLLVVLIIGRYDLRNWMSKKNEKFIDLSLSLILRQMTQASTVRLSTLVPYHRH